MLLVFHQPVDGRNGAAKVVVQIKFQKGVGNFFDDLTEGQWIIENSVWDN